MRPRRAVAALAAVLTLAASVPARADNHSEAVKAFEEGRKIRDRDPDRALRIFQASIALEPSVGAYFNIANIHEQQGRAREAIEMYRKSEALAKERHDERDKDAAGAIQKLLDSQNYVIVKVDPTIASTSGLRVMLDNELVPREQYNSEVFRTQAAHEVSVTASGYKERRTPATNRQIVIIALGDPVPAGGDVPPPPPPPPSGNGWGWQKWTGAGAVAAGLVTAGIGVALHLDHLGRIDEIKKGTLPGCGNPCTVEGKKAVDDNRVDINAKIEAENSRGLRTFGVAYTVGGILVIGGAILFLTAPSPAPSTPTTGSIRVVPQLGPKDAGLHLIGTF